MVFLEVTKPTLIRPFLAKEFSLFFKIYLFELEANYNAVVVFAILDMNLPRVYTCAPSWTPLPPPSPSHPSGSSQCTSPEHPVSCIEPELAICFTYDNIHVSMLFSQIITPWPSPTESKRLFCTSVSLLLSRIHCYRCHLYKFHIYVLLYCIGVFLSISLCIIGSSFIYLIRTDSSVFFFMAE